MLKQKLVEKQQLAYGYSRVSTKEQEKGGISLETQSAKITDYCKSNNLKLVKIFTDSVSGKNMDERPEFLALLQTVKDGDYIIFSDLSRLSRRASDSLNTLEKYDKVKFICLSPNIDFSTVLGKLMFTIMAGVAESERGNIGVHVKSNMQRISKEGKLRSHPPIGWKFVGKDKDYEPVESQQQLIQEIIKRYKEGKTFSRIAKELNEEGENIKLLDNKPINPDRKIPMFGYETIRTILIHAGEITDPNRKPIEQRIKSFRNELEK